MNRTLIVALLLSFGLAGPACSSKEESTCVATLCQAGETRCFGNAVGTCATDGKSWSVNACGSTRRCDQATCVERSCTPGNGWCGETNGPTLSRCLPDGSGEEEVTCGEGTHCVSGACVDAQCTHGGTACASLTFILTCDGGSWTGESCADGEICHGSESGAVCKPPTCVAESVSCEDNTVVSCDVYGREVTKTDCGANEVCKAGLCVAKVCGVDDQPDVVEPTDIATDAGTDATGPVDVEEDTFIPPLEPISRVEFKLAGQTLVFDLNARGIYIGSDKQLMIIGEKGTAQIEIRIGPIEPFVVGSWNESDGAEIGVAVCYNDGISPLPEPLAPCQVGFTHVSIEYTLTLDDNNGPDSWLRGTFTATLEDVNGDTIRIKDGLFEVLHK